MGTLSTSGSHALQSITKSVNLETHSTQVYGCKKQLTRYGRSSSQYGTLARNGELHGKVYEEQRAIALEMSSNEVSRIMKKQNFMSMMPKADYSMADRLNRFSRG
jgi:hypothetical protein